MHAVILAGGNGTRLWPVSRADAPKQLQRFVGDATLLEQVVDWVAPVFDDGMTVVTGAAHTSAVEVLVRGRACVLAEPCVRGTLVAISAAVSRLPREAIFVVINSDVHVLDVEAYRAALARLEAVVRAQPERLTLVGIEPTSPETGYGYIELGEAMDVAGHRVHRTARFKEKPDAVTAREYVRSGRFLWNPTIIAARAETFLRAVARHAPEVFAGITRLQEGVSMEEVYAQISSQSVDYGVLERETDMLVMKAQFGWTDVGNWRTVWERGAHDEHENVVEGAATIRESRGCLVRNDSSRPVAVVGLDDVVVVQTEEATLVVHKGAAQSVREVAALCEPSKQYESHEVISTTT